MSNQISLLQEFEVILESKFCGAFIGAAIGDALGFITEFTRSPQDLQGQLALSQVTRLIDWRRVTRRQQYSVKLPFPAGTFSDDTQLTLATARSIRADGYFDVESFAKLELPVWLEYELGGGKGTKASAKNLIKKNVRWFENFYVTAYTNYLDSGGNGAAMRILPIALINSNNQTQCYIDVWRNAIVTHGHPRGILGAILFADALISLLEKPSTKTAWLQGLIDICSAKYSNLPELWLQIPEFSEWKQMWETRTKKSFATAWRETCEETKQQLKFVEEHLRKSDHAAVLSRLGCYEQRTKGAGHSTVIAAIFFLCRNENFENAVVSVANELGIDTDTIGYFVGAMFGAYYGIESIPTHFRDVVQDSNYLLKLAQRCYQIYSRQNLSMSEFNYSETKLLDALRNLNIQLKNINPNEIIEFPVLGKGKVISCLDITPSWKGQHLYWLQVSLDIGQTLFLQSIRPYIENSVNGAKKVISQEHTIVSSLAILDEFKDKIESNGNSGFIQLIVLNICS